jgi:hypothetical protein
MVKQNSKNNESDKSDSMALNLESLNKEYKNLLIEYEQAVANYVNYLKQELNQPCSEYKANNKDSSQDCHGKDNKKYNTSTSPNYNINKPQLTSVKGTAFWGTSALSQSKVTTVEQCQALCSNTTGCSGATYNETTTLCSLRKGDANIVAGSPTDYSIVPKSQSLLKIVQNINNKLTQVNEKIQKISPSVEIKLNLEAEQRLTANNDLIEQYKNLVIERTKIQNMLNEYQTLDQQQIEGNIYISQNYYSFILLMILAILFVFLLYKFYTPSVESSTTYIQSGGQLGTSAYYIIFGIFLLILLLTCYNKYKLL